MALKLTVRKNYLPSCPSPFNVRSDTVDVVDYARLIDIMAGGRTTLSKPDIGASMQLFSEELERLLAEGRTVKTLIGSFYPCASGTMQSLDESFLPRDAGNNHEVRIHFRPERSFEEAVRLDLRIVREEKPDYSSPSIRTVRAAGGDEGASVQPGGIVQIHGLRLRFDPKDPKQGVFFEDSGGAQTRSPSYPMILPSTLLAAVPEGLAPGAYALVVRAAVNGKDVREDRLEGIDLASPA